MWQPKFAHTLKKSTFLSGMHCERRMWWEIKDKGEPFLSPLPTPVPTPQGVRFQPVSEVLPTAY